MRGSGVDDAGLERITGSIESVRYRNEENGYVICDLGIDDDIITVVGNMPYISEGDSVTVTGAWVHNPKYGRQFRVDGCERNMPSGSAAILRYLASRSIKGIGPKTAQRIVDMFGDDTLDVIENHPDWLTQVQGISPKKATEIAGDFKEKSGIRSTMMFLREYFGVAMTVRIYKKWGSSSVDIARENPYRLCEEIEGIGFEKADGMAQKLGLAGDSDDRVSSGVRYMLRVNATQSGHVCLPREKLIAASAVLLGVPESKTAVAVSTLMNMQKLRSETYNGVEYIFDSHMYGCEKYIAEKLDLLDKVHLRVDAGDIGRFVALEEAKSGMEYAAMQKKAIYDALSNGVMILTGGPGTGKTTIVRALIDIFRSIDMKVALAAPTGRAAKRLSESTSYEAKTIHRLLEVDFGGEDEEYRGLRFRKCEDDLLDEDVIIIDEASMVDCPLMCSLLKAVRPGARFIFIGDADQLPSVGAGNVLRDLIECKRFATICLTEIFRQAQMSLIVTNAHAINEGNMPLLDVHNGDFFFLPRSSDRDIAETIADLYENRLPRAYGELASGVQIISPSRRGEPGTEHLNMLIQEKHNPKSDKKREFKFRDTVFREGDRVMQIKNNYDIGWTRDEEDGTGIFNGDIGTVILINRSEECMEIQFDDRTVEYPFDLLEELELAYAVTVHKSQGSEYPIVIIPAFSAPRPLLTRNLLYTAVTRARKMVIIVGRSDIVSYMVKNNRQSMRYTCLAKRFT